jgi:hypothetical protein
MRAVGVLTSYVHVSVDWDHREVHQAGQSGQTACGRGGSVERFGENSMDMSREMGRGRGTDGQQAVVL